MLDISTSNKPTTSDSQAPNKNTKNQIIDTAKKFSCKKCGAAFLQMETFKRHLNFYCNSKTDESAQTENPTTQTMTSTPHESSASVANLAEILAVLQQREQLRQNALRQNATRMQSLLDPSGIGATTNTILLPVAFHQSLDPALIQIVGPPQTIIPVAIGRQMPAVSRPLLLDGALLPSLRLASNSRIPLGSNGDFHLPLASIQQWPAMPSLIPSCPQNERATSGATATATVTSMSSLSPSLLLNSGENGKATKRARSALSTPSSINNKRRRSSTDKPLDLTTNSGTKSTDESAGSSSETMDNETERTKKFACECGVSFLSFDTLSSHRRYYCSRRVVDETDEREMVRKVPSRCSHCEYTPTTHAQLAQHVRHKHCAIQAYVCLLCGYKGYSARGIKNHLRNSHTDEMNKRRSSIGEENLDDEQAANVLSDKSLLQDYVFCVTDSTKQLPCQACRSTFPTQQLLQKHNCPARKSENDEEMLTREDIKIEYETDETTSCRVED